MIKVELKKKLAGSSGVMVLDVDFEIKNNEFVTLFGPSGSGKSSILRMIAGLMEPDEGLIEVDREIWFDSQKKINKPVQHRGIGLVFQDHNLFPHMTVKENLEYGSEGVEYQSLMEELVSMMNLKELMDSKTPTLSGGQKQRVALIRALLRKPKIFLLDEPLSSLDWNLRLKIQNEIAEIYQRFNIPTIFVTHDLSELFKLSQQILMLDNGKIYRSGRPQDIFGGENLSGKFKFVGTILELKKEDFLTIVTVQIGNNLTKVVATDEEAAGWIIGDRVIVSAKAFNPIIVKV